MFSSQKAPKNTFINPADKKGDWRIDRERRAKDGVLRRLRGIFLANRSEDLCDVLFVPLCRVGLRDRDLGPYTAPRDSFPNINRVLRDHRELHVGAHRDRAVKQRVPPALLRQESEHLLLIGPGRHDGIGPLPWLGQRLLNIRLRRALTNRSHQKF